MPWARSFCPFRACGAKLAKLEIFDIPPLGGKRSRREISSEKKEEKSLVVTIIFSIFAPIKQAKRISLPLVKTNIDKNYTYDTENYYLSRHCCALFC